MPLTNEHARDLQAGLDALSAKRRLIDSYWDYYDDIQAPSFLNEHMRKKFQNLNDKFSLNLCRLAIITPLNRLWVESWEHRGAQSLWERKRLEREQKRIYKHALVSGEAYIVGWKGELNNEPKVAFNDPRIIHLFHEVDDPGTKAFAVKVWKERDHTTRAIIYYPDHIIRLVGRTRPEEYHDLILKDKPTTTEAMTPGNFDYDPVDPGGPHTMGEVPVWRFASDLWNPESRLKDLIPIQDVVNKLRSNKMVASESSAYPQRIYFTMQDLDAESLKNEPNTSLVLDPGDRESPASVTQFEAAQLQNYDQSIDAEIQNFFTVAHLPRHLLISPGADSSGDAIRSDEGPFQEMVQDIATNFGYAWSDMMMALTGESNPSKIQPEWQDARINNAEAQAREFKELVEGGMPPAFAAKKAFQWSLDEAKEANLAETVEQVQNLSDRSPSPTRTQTTEDEPQ